MNVLMMWRFLWKIRRLVYDAALTAGMKTTVVFSIMSCPWAMANGEKRLNAGPLWNGESAGPGIPDGEVWDLKTVWECDFTKKPCIRSRGKSHSYSGSGLRRIYFF